MLFINKLFNSIACLLYFINLQLVIPGRTLILLYLGRTVYKRLWACLALYDQIYDYFLLIIYPFMNSRLHCSYVSRNRCNAVFAFRHFRVNWLAYKNYSSSSNQNGCIKQVSTLKGLCIQLIFHCVYPYFVRIWKARIGWPHSSRDEIPWWYLLTAKLTGSRMKLVWIPRNRSKRSL